MKRRRPRFEDMRDFSEEFDDMPDGAFFALAEERGITVDDWLRFNEECKRRRAKKQPIWTSEGAPPQG